MKFPAYLVLMCLLVLTLSSFDNSGNTPISRAMAALNTRYNVFFNGEVSYKEGIRKLNLNSKDDYSNIIPLYPISNKASAKTADGEMTRSIEKCRKAIKTFSIKKKPAFDPKKAKDKDYKNWYAQEEFNPVMKDVWMALAKSEFHKGDFLGASGTFSYISKHYSTDEDLKTACNLWMVRSYAEMDWMYEAEQLLGKTDVAKLKGDNLDLYVCVESDMLLKKKLYADAIPFVEKALSKEKDKYLKRRFTFLLGQLYKKTDQKNKSYQTFTDVIKSNPPYELEFNARLQRAELYKGSMKSIRKELQKMLNNPNNKNYQDQIYYALANSYLYANDTARAVILLESSIEKSLNKGKEKGANLLLLGDLQYDRKKFNQALPPYKEASKIFTIEDDSYPRISKRAEVLEELVKYYDECQLQDSLQRLSKLTDGEKLKVIQKMLAQMELDEKKAAEKAAKLKAQEQNSSQNMSGPGEMPGMENFEVGRPARSTGSWYFYNNALMQSGQTDFVKKWGKRKLEDNWRRSEKSTPMYAENLPEETKKDSITTPKDSASVQLAVKDSVVTDKKNPIYYLRQIPKTPEQLAASDKLWAEALFNLALLYKEKLGDSRMAIASFDQYLKKFKTYEKAPEACFQNYMLYYSLNQPAKAEDYRETLLNDFKESNFASNLKNPDYIYKSKKMFQVQDSVYALAYAAYNDNKFTVVKDQYAFMQKNYPMSPLMPKFMFLSVLSTGKTQKQEVFEAELNQMVETFPSSDVSSMAKDILALMSQGLKSKKGTTQGTLLAKREADVQAEADGDIVFSKDKEGKHRLLLIADAKPENLNRLMYQVAVFNFTRFMVKDFDLSINKIDTALQALSITNLQNFEEAANYQQVITNDQFIRQLMEQYNAKPLIVSETNFAMIRPGAGFRNYLAFTKDKSFELSNPISENLLKRIDKVSLSVDEMQVARPPVPSAVANTNKSASKTAPTSATTLYKNLYLYESGAPHGVMIYVQSGMIDIAAITKMLDQYNKDNYSMLNLKVDYERKDRLQLFYIQSFPDAVVALSYMNRLIREKAFQDQFARVNFRTLPGTMKNLKTMIDRNALAIYTEFIRQYYLK